MATANKTKQAIKSDKPYSVLVDGCFSLSVSFKLIAGKKKLEASDIGIDPSTLPEHAIRLGSKQVIPKEEIKKLNDIKNDVEGYLSTIGFKIHGVWNAPLDLYDEANAYLEEKKAIFINAKRHIVMNVQDITNEWADLVEAERPGMGQTIREAAYSPEYIADKVHFESIFWQNANDVAALSLFQDIAKTAKQQLDDITSFKNKCTKNTCLDTMTNIRKKLIVLRFVDDRVNVVLARIDRFLMSVPTKGKLPPTLAQDLAVELSFLSNPTHLMSLADLTDIDVSSEEIQSQLDVPSAELEALLATPPKPPANTFEPDLFAVC